MGSDYVALVGLEPLGTGDNPILVLQVSGTQGHATTPGSYLNHFQAYRGIKYTGTSVKPSTASNWRFFLIFLK